MRGDLNPAQALAAQYDQVTGGYHRDDDHRELLEQADHQARHFDFACMAGFPVTKTCVREAASTPSLPPVGAGRTTLPSTTPGKKPLERACAGSGTIGLAAPTEADGPATSFKDVA